MIREITKIDIGQIVEIGEQHIELEAGMDKIIQERQCYTNNYRNDFR